MKLPVLGQVSKSPLVRRAAVRDREHAPCLLRIPGKTDCPETTGSVVWAAGGAALCLHPLSPLLPSQHRDLPRPVSLQLHATGLGPGGGDKGQPGLQTWHVVCRAPCLVLPLTLTRGRNPPEDVCWGQCRALPLLCFKKEEIWFRKPTCLLGRAPGLL